MKIRISLADTVIFRELVFAMLRRVLELARFHVPGAQVDWHFRPLLDQADAIRCTPHLTWQTRSATATASRPRCSSEACWDVWISKEI